MFDVHIRNNNNTAITVKSRRIYLMVKGDPATLKSIEVAQEPDKVEYAKNEPLDFTGLVVNAIYNDGTVEEITSVCSYDPQEGSPAELDWNRVDIWIHDNDKLYSTSFTIDVSESDANLISGPDIHSLIMQYFN